MRCPFNKLIFFNNLINFNRDVYNRLSIYNISTMSSTLFTQLTNICDDGTCKLLSLDDANYLDISGENDFTEVYNAKKLIYLANRISDVKLTAMGDRDITHDNCNLNKFIKSSEVFNGFGSINVKYQQAYYKFKKGDMKNKSVLVGHRQQAIQALSGQAMMREPRYCAYNDSYQDIDSVNCHPNLICWICDNLGIYAGVLKHYCENRDSVFKELYSANDGCSKGDCKSLFIRIMYGCSSKSSLYFDEEHKRKINHTVFSSRFRNEFKTICKAICDKYVDMFKLTEMVKHDKGKSYNYHGTCLSYICGYYENQMIQRVLKFIKSMNKDYWLNSVLCFDGIMVYKSGLFADADNLNAFIETCNSWFADNGCAYFRLEKKTMDCDYLERFGYDNNCAIESLNKVVEDVKTDLVKTKSKSKRGEDLDIKHDFIKELIEEISALPKTLISFENDLTRKEIIDIEEYDSIYELAKNIKSCYAFIDSHCSAVFMCKTRLKVNNGKGFVYESIYEQMDMHKCSEMLITITIKHNGYDISFKLHDLIIRCFKAIKYDYIGCYPYSPKDTFDGTDDSLNIFKPWMYRYDNSFTINQLAVDTFLFHTKEILCNNDESCFNYIIGWLASIIQRPMQKTGVCPIFKSSQGVGKGIWFNLISDYIIGGNHALMVNSLDTLISKFNAVSFNKQLIAIDEALDSKCHSANSMMKNLITETKQKLELKGKDALEVNSYTNYVVFTNNDFQSLIETNDRRYVCIQCNDRYASKINDIANPLSSEMASKLLSLYNTDDGKSIFHWLASYDLTDFKIMNIPTTNYKKELVLNQANHAIKFLISKLEKILADVNNNVYDNDKISSDSQFVLMNSCDMLFREFNEYKRDENVKCDYSKRLFDKLIREAGFELLRKKLCGVEHRYRDMSVPNMYANLSKYMAPDSEVAIQYKTYIE